MKHVQTGMCINDTSIIVTEGLWGNMSYLELYNNCLDQSAQFHFVDTSAMLNLKRPGCLHPLHFDRRPDLLLLWVASISEVEKGNSCDQKLAIAQTSWGGLSVQYEHDRYRGTPHTHCADPKADQGLADQGINSYIGLTTDCSDSHTRRFNFGKFLATFHVLPLYDIKKIMHRL